MARIARVSAVAALAAALLLPSVAAAQGSSIAEQLFVEGKALMQAGKHEEACAKLKASHNLDTTATGTLLNLALCHEQIGKVATAWAEFRQVAAESAGRREDRVALAREHEAKLAPLLPRVRVDVPPEARVDGLTLQLDDGDPISEGSWGVEVRIDPGPHVVLATAPKKLAGKTTFTIPTTATVTEVAIAPLADAPPEPTQTVDTTEVERQAARRTRRIVGLAIASAGVVALGVAVGFGVKAKSDNDEAVDTCPGDRCVDASALRSADDALASAKSSALIANVIAAAGGALVIGGGVLFVTALGSGKSAPKKETAWRFVPSASAAGASFTLGRAF